jgi:hypothetical protein
MRLLPMLLSLFMPLCATTGTEGINPPGVVDFSHFQRARYSTALIAPAGFSPQPDFIAPVFNIPAPALFADLQRFGNAQPRSYPLDTEPAALQAAWIVRSAACNFPDLVEIAVVPKGAHASSFIFYSHAIYGWYAYGVNDNRAKTWLKAIDMELTP